MTIAAVLLTVAAAVLALPVVVFAVECFAGIWPALRRSTAVEVVAPKPRTAVVVPAHDEEGGIAATIGHIRRDFPELHRLVVVADNCTDATASVAKSGGVEVIERREPKRRGKGYALSFALDYLKADPPDVVVIVDADCRPLDGALSRIASLAYQSGRPIQADYVLEPPSGANAKTRVSAFALIVRNRIRPRGLLRFGMPCQLMGSGMAFPWVVISRATPTRGNVVEDLAMGIELTSSGTPPLFCPQASVVSVLPSGEGAAMTQRRRWETGQLATAFSAAPKLIVGGLLRAQPKSVALGLDLAVPPLALLVFLVLGGTAAAGAFFLAGGSLTPLVVFGSELALLGFTVFVTWIAGGRSVLPLRHALAIPLYVLWKLPMYVAMIVRGRESSWVRTERDAGR